MSKRVSGLLVIVALLCIASAVCYAIWSPRRQAQLVAQAIKALEARKTEEAVALLQAALAYTPSNGQARYLLARAYHLQGEPQAALAELEKVPVADRNAELARVQIAAIQLESNRPGQAEQTLRDCLVRFPESVAARQYLMDVLGLQLREREMFPLLDELWELSQSRLILDRAWVLAKTFHLRFIKQHEEQIWPTLQAFARQEPDNIHTQVASGKLLLAMRTNTEEAARILKSCLERSPDNLEAIAALASHYVEHGAAENQEIDSLLARWSLSGNDARYWQVLGDSQVQRGQLNEGLESYRQARSLDSAEWRTAHKMGMLLTRIAKQNGDRGESQVGEGQRLIQEAAALKELRTKAADCFDYLQNWLNRPTGTSPHELRPAQLTKMAEIAAFCEATHYPIDAMRWCEVIQRAAPGEPTSLAIRKRMAGQLEGKRALQFGTPP